MPAATPVLLNLGMIVGVWLLAPTLERAGFEPIYALAAGVMLGGVLQLAVQVPALARIGLLPRIGARPAADRRGVAPARRAPHPAARWRRRCSASRWRSCRS